VLARGGLYLAARSQQVLYQPESEEFEPADREGMMRVGILIIGSLLWDNKQRCDWRQSHLRLNDMVCIKVPIRYGRLSEGRGNTYTMVLGTGEDFGDAVLVPCMATIEDDGARLIAEAEALWKAEQPRATLHTMSASWGCVGALFLAKSTVAEKGWVKDFRSKVRKPTLPVDADGKLGVQWQITTVDGSPPDMDVILATATQPAPTRPSPAGIADAWIAQHGGHERYFFENVRHGIRTPEDGLIWRRIEERAPPWLQSGAYGQAVSLLRAEEAQRA